MPYRVRRSEIFGGKRPAKKLRTEIIAIEGGTRARYILAGDALGPAKKLEISLRIKEPV